MDVVERTQVVASSQATSLLQAITNAASNPQIDIEKMERLFAMHEKMVAHEAEAAFNAAMARAQTNMIPIITNAKNEHTASRYADLAAINEKLVPIYSAEGLSISFDTETFNEKDPVPPGMLRTVALVSHANGHSRRHHIDLFPDDAGAQGKVNKTRVQAAGSTNEYARRYLVRMIFNVSTKDDNGGNNKRPAVEPDAEGKKTLEACGSLGALQAAWKALTAKQRSTLNEVKDECKARIEAADKGAA